MLERTSSCGELTARATLSLCQIAESYTNGRHRDDGIEEGSAFLLLLSPQSSQGLQVMKGATDKLRYIIHWTGLFDSLPPPTSSNSTHSQY